MCLHSTQNIILLILIYTSYKILVELILKWKSELNKKTKQADLHLWFQDILVEYKRTWLIELLFTKNSKQLGHFCFPDPRFLGFICNISPKKMPGIIANPWKFRCTCTEIKILSLLSDLYFIWGIIGTELKIMVSIHYVYSLI